MNLKELSKGNFSSEVITTEMINAGSLQRVADAAELTERNYNSIKYSFQSGLLKKK